MSKYIPNKHVPYLTLTFAVLFVLFAATACGASKQETLSATAAPTGDTSAIVDEVLTEVNARLAERQQVNSTPPIDTDAIAAQVMTEVTSQLEEQSPTPAPTVDVNDLTAAVLAQVDAQLEQEAAALPAVSLDIEQVLIDLYRQANPSVVYIVVPQVGSGSGFVYSTDGTIVTNNHVVANAREYEVIFANGERMAAELVGTDVDSDLAVIKVDHLPEGVEPLPLAAPEAVQVGQLVVAIGNPFGKQGSMSLGIISGLDRSLRSQRDSLAGTSYSLPEVVQTDAPINPGNSGGPLLNLQGEVVGVNSAIASNTGTNSGVGFAIPVAAVRQVVPSLVENGEFVYPYMGATFDAEITLSQQSALGLPQTQGAYVVAVTRGGPADAAGLIPANENTGRGGDLIVQIDDQEIQNFADLNSYLVFHTTVGQTIDLTVLRGDKEVVLPLTLGARP